MKKSVLIFTFLFLAGTLFAQKNVGVGVRISSIAGLNVKYWTSNISAFDASLSWTVDSYWYLESNYINHWRGLLDNFTFFPFISAGVFGGKSRADGIEIYRLTSGWFQGLILKGGVSFPIYNFDATIDSGIRFLTYPKIEPDYNTSFVFRFWF